MGGGWEASDVVLYQTNSSGHLFGIENDGFEIDYGCKLGLNLIERLGKFLILWIFE